MDYGLWRWIKAWPLRNGTAVDFSAGRAPDHHNMIWSTVVRSTEVLTFRYNILRSRKPESGVKFDTRISTVSIDHGSFALCF